MLELRPALGDSVCMMMCVSRKERLNLKWITSEDILGLHRLREPYGSFERLCSAAFCWRVEKQLDYAISGALASLFFTFSDVDGLAYSSSATAMKGVNLALKPAIVDAYVAPVSFRSYSIAEVYCPGDFLVKCTGWALAPDEVGNIEWGDIVECPGHRVSTALFEKPAAEEPPACPE